LRIGGLTQVVNLNRARKARTKAESAKAAEVNRIKFGRTKAEKEAAERDRERAVWALDQARRDET
jgi:hypothetical protein